VPPAITAPATIPTFFITFLFKNFALSRSVSVGGEEGEGVDPSDGKWCNGANPSGIGTNSPDTGSGEGIHPSDAEKWCGGE
jgi:hypothetical protein